MNLLCTNKIILDCSSKHSLLNTTLKMMIFVNLFQTIFNFFRGYFGQLIAQRISATIRNKLFRSILWNDLSFFENSKTGMLLSRLSSDTKQFSGFCTEFIPKIMNNFFGILLSLGYALFISPSLTLLMLAAVPISSMLSRYFSNFYRDLSRKLQHQLAKSTDIAFESISNIKTIKSFSAESKVELSFVKQVQNGYLHSTRIVLAERSFEAIKTILAFLSIASVLWFVAKTYAAKQMDAGNAVTFLILSIQISIYMKRSMGIWLEFHQKHWRN